MMFVSRFRGLKPMQFHYHMFFFFQNKLSNVEFFIAKALQGYCLFFEGLHCQLIALHFFLKGSSLLE